MEGKRMGLEEIDQLGWAAADVAVPAPESYRHDWFGRSGRVDAVLRPQTTAAAQEALRLCSRNGWVIIPQGGNSGLVGGTVLQRSDPDVPVVVISTERLTEVTVDAAGGTALAQAGVSVAELQRQAAAVGMTYGVDLASRDSATVGGTVATNAGGIHVCAYGSTRAQVLGIQAVLADGRVVDDLGGLPKDNTGYSLSDLLCGSEGTLAFLTAARLRLHPAPQQPAVFVVGVPSLTAAVQLGRRAHRATDRLLACEVVDRRSWQRAAADMQQRDPVPALAGAYLAVVEVDLGERQVDALAPLLADSPEAAVAVDAADRAELWLLRESQAEWWAQQTTAPGTVLQKYDVTLPLATIDAAMRLLAELLTERTTAWGVFGHVYEGSLHLQGVADATSATALDEIVLRTVSELGGSLSAEHGVGRDKAGLLGLRRSETELQIMRGIKVAWDPAGRLNPGVILP